MCLVYMARRNIAAGMLVPGGGSSEASTSSAPPPLVPEAIPYPEEIDPVYRWFAFPVDAPPRGASRPLVLSRRDTCYMTQRVVVGGRDIG